MTAAHITTLHDGDAQAVGDDLPLLLRVEDAARQLGVGRTLMFRLLKTGDVESVFIGSLRLVPAECLDEYVARLRRRARSSSSAA